MSKQLELIADKILVAYPTGLSIGNITEIVIDIMKQVDVINGMSGVQKKTLVLNILNRLVERTDSGSYDEQIDSILKIIIPTLIDKLIDIDQGRLKIKKNVFKFNCFTQFCK